MSVFTTKDFWLQTLERAIKTFCQTVLGAVGVTAVAIQEIPWTVVLATAATTTVLSILTSVASSGVGDRNSPSVIPVQVEAPAPEVVAVETTSAPVVTGFAASLPEPQLVSPLLTGGVVNDIEASRDPANDLTANTNIVRGEN